MTFDPHDEAAVGPSQFATQCVANLRVGVGEATSEFLGPGAGKFRKEALTKGCSCRSALLLLHNPAPDLPLRGDHGGIDGGVNGGPGTGKDAPHVAEKFGGWGEVADVNLEFGILNGHPSPLFCRGDESVIHKQQFLYFFPLPQAQGALREIFGALRMMLSDLVVVLMSL